MTRDEIQEKLRTEMSVYPRDFTVVETSEYRKLTRLRSDLKASIAARENKLLDKHSRELAIMQEKVTAAEEKLNEEKKKNAELSEVLAETKIGKDKIKEVLKATRLSKLQKKLEAVEATKANLLKNIQLVTEGKESESDTSFVETNKLKEKFPCVDLDDQLDIREIETKKLNKRKKWFRCDQHGQHSCC